MRRLFNAFPPRLKKIYTSLNDKKQGKFNQTKKLPRPENPSREVVKI
jgi:hypothetical protein